MNKSLLKHIQNTRKDGRKLLAVLLDPDKLALEDVATRLAALPQEKINVILVGGSLLFTNILDAFIREIKNNTELPVVIFPGNAMQISEYADAILFLSLISGRNPEFLIGNQVVAAPLLKQTDLEIIPTGYLLIESGRETTASYISNTRPIPRHKPEIAMATALAGEMMGHQLIYLDGGSGALQPVPESVIKSVRNHTQIPIVVGGGIRTEAQLRKAYNAGADMVVIGTAFEENIRIFDIL